MTFAASRTRLDRILDQVQTGKREVTIDAEGYSAEQVEQIRAAAKARGFHVSGTRRWLLIRDLRERKPNGARDAEWLALVREEEDALEELRTFGRDDEKTPEFRRAYQRLQRAKHARQDAQHAERKPNMAGERDGEQLYDQLRAAGATLDNHESDLYVLATPEAREIVQAWARKRKTAAPGYSTFRSDVDGKTWLDVPFEYLPFWDKKRKRNARVDLERIPLGPSEEATRTRQAQRRERIRRSSAGESVPCERCGREYCLEGDYLGPRCRGDADQTAERLGRSRNPEVSLTRDQLAAAKSKLKDFYRVKRTISTEEVRATLEMLHGRRGEYDALLQQIADLLSTGRDPIEGLR